MKKTLGYIIVVGTLATMLAPANLLFSSSSMQLQDHNSQQDKNQIKLLDAQKDTTEIVTCDHTSPYFRDLNPSRHKQDVSRFTTIKFTAKDDPIDLEHDLSGIDTSTVFISVRSKSVNVTKAKPKLRYSDAEFYSVNFEYLPPDSFACLDTIYVKLEANDRSRFKNYGSTEYWFVIEPAPIPVDYQAPRFENLSPESNSEGNSRNTAISFDVLDNVAIDTTSIELSIQSRNLSIDSAPISIQQIDTLRHVRCTYKPDQALDWSDEVNIILSASDTSSNANTTNYQFYTEKDIFPPVLVADSPGSGDKSVPQDAVIKISGSDVGRGVKTDDIRLEINGNPVEPVIGGDLFNFNITFQPEIPWNLGMTVTVLCIAQDMDSNADTLSFSFEIVDDLMKPWFENLYPAPETIESARDDSIRFTVLDDLAGVNPGSITIDIGNGPAPLHSIQPVPRGFSCAYALGQPFDWNDTVSVALHACDLLGKCSDTTYTFYIVKDLNPPAVTLIEPDDITNAPINGNIKIAITDEKSGVDFSTLILKVNDLSVPGSSLIKLTIEDGYLITYNPESDFEFNTNVKVEVAISDYAKNDTAAIFNFKTEIDTTGPYFINIIPAPNSTEVDTNVVIYFTVVDDQSDVDRESVTVSLISRQLEIPDTPATFIEEFVPDSLRYKFEIDAVFDWTDTVKVTLNAKDTQGNPGELKYEFYTKRDIFPPVLEAIFPTDGASNVSIDAEVIIHGTDVGRGVDISDKSNINFLVNGVKITEYAFTDNSTDWDFEIHYKPQTNWSPNQAVKILCQVNDRDANPSNELKFAFTIECSDTAVPWFENLSPAQGATEVSRSDSIRFTVLDDCAGVNPDSIKINIGNGLAPPQKISPLPGGFSCAYAPGQPFDWNDTVSVALHACDLLGKCSDITFTFYVETDTTPPAVVLIKPETAVNVPIDTDIQLEITDQKSGVDLSTMTLVVNGSIIPVVHSDTVNIEDIENGFRITYSPSLDFELGQNVPIKVSVSDSANNQNIEKYNFKTEIDTTGPHFIDISPAPDEAEVDTNTVIYFTVVDDQSDVDKESVTVSLISRQLEIPETPATFIEEFAPNSLRYKFEIDAVFDWTDTVNVILKAKDSAEPQNESSLPFTFYTVRDIFPPVLEAFYPASGAQGVPVDTILIIHGTDKGRGCDISNKDDFNITILDNPVQINSIVGTPWDFYIYISHVIDWEPCLVMNLCGQCYDLDRNQSNNLCVCFTTECGPDLVCPWFVDLDPYDGEKEVSRTESIRFTVLDDNAGVNRETITVDIGNGPVAPQIIDSYPHGYKCIYIPPQNFEWNDTINVTLFACDNLGKCCDSNYTFYVETDTTPPFVFDQVPQPSNTYENLQAPIEFKISDVRSGVITESIKLFVSLGDSIFQIAEQESVTVDSIDINTYLVKSESSISFYCQDSIWVKITASDSAGNAAEIKYNFTVPEDDQAPAATMIEPQNRNNVPITQRIVIEVTDENCGVDTNSFVFHVEGDSGYVSDVFSIEKINELAYRIIHIPESPYDYGEKIYVTLNGRDLGDHWFAFSDSFIVLSDTTGPMVFDHNPEPLSQIDEFGCKINFKLKDDLTGIDVSSINVKYSINDNSNFNSLGFVPKEKGDAIFVECKLKQFAWNDIVYVKIYAKDNAGNETKYDPFPSAAYYSFRVPEDYQKPIVQRIEPAFSNKNSVDQEIVLLITDALSGVSTENISLLVQGSVDYRSTLFNLDTGDIHSVKVKHIPESNYYQGEEISIKLEVSDLAGNTMMFEDTLTIVNNGSLPNKITVYDHVPGIEETIKNFEIPVKFKMKDQLQQIMSKSISVGLQVNDAEQFFPQVKKIENDGIYQVETFDKLHLKYNDTVHVSIYAATKDGVETDKSGADRTVNYIFYAPVDKMKPTAVMINPNKSDSVSVTEPIIIEVSDTISKIDAATITLNVKADSANSHYNSTDYSLQQIDDFTWQVIHTPTARYFFNSTVNVNLTVKDFAGNICELDTFFQTSPYDLNPPKIVNIIPTDSSQLETIGLAITFDVLDDFSGVNQNSIVVKYSLNENFDPAFEIPFTSSGSGDCVHAVSDFTEFGYCQHVRVKIHAADMMGNAADSLFSFFTKRDTDSPVLFSYSPDTLELNQPVSLIFKDDMSGVSSSSIDIIVKNKVNSSIPILILKNPDEDAATINVDIKPIESRQWEYNDVLTIVYSLHDKCGNAAHDSLEIPTKQIAPDLSVENVTTSADNRKVNINTIIHVEAIILNENEDCILPFNVNFYLDNKGNLLRTQNVSGLAKDQRITVETEFKIEVDGKHFVEVCVDSPEEAGPGANCKNSPYFYVDDGIVVVKSNPFTPNGDNINDEAEFDFKEVQILSIPALKIFDIHGNLIVELRGNHGEKKIRWNGLDNRGKSLLPGVYLFILSDGSKAKARGCVAIAR